MMQSETQIGWQDYLAIILRRRWFFAIPCATIVVVAMVVGLFLPKIYRAETIMLVDEPNASNPLVQGLAALTPVGQRMRTLREELLSWTSLSRLVNELKLDKRAKNPIAFEGLVKHLQNEIDVRMRGGNLIVIGYEDQDPKLAQTLVNTITNIYMERNVESQTAETNTAIGFIENEMAVYKKKLEDAEEALREFKELYVMQMPVANQLNQQIIDLEVLLARLLVEDTEEHPTVIQLRRQILDLKQKRNDEIKRVIVTALTKGHDPKFFQDLAKALEQPVNPDAIPDPAIRAGKEAYQAWVNRLDSNVTPPQPFGQQVQVVAVTPGQAGKPVDPVGVLGAGAASISLGPREEQELARLTRDYSVYSETYQRMQERLERARVTQRFGESDEGTKFKILEPARLPLRPVRPNHVKIFFFSLLLGIFVGAGIAFVAEYLDQSFQSAEEVQEALALPIIGTISTIVTEGDVEATRQRRKRWVSYKDQFQRLRTHVVDPVWTQIWSRVDRVLVRWGL